MPERLAAIFAQICERRSVGIGMARDIFPNSAIRMPAEPLQSLRIRTRMFTDQAKQIIILFRSLLDEFFEHFRLRVGAQNQPNLLVPRGVDLVEFARARMDQLFE